MTDVPPEPPEGRPPRRNDRLHTVGAGLLAILAVLAGVLLVNLVRSGSGQDEAAPQVTPTASPTTVTSEDTGTGQPGAGPDATPGAGGDGGDATTTAAPTPTEQTQTPAAPPEPPPPPPPAPEPVFEPVVILNKSTIRGQAEAAVERVEALGFRVDRVGNFVSTYNVPVSTVYYDSGHEAAARTMLERVPGVEKIIRKSETNIKSPEPLILVVTKDFPTDLTEG